MQVKNLKEWVATLPVEYDECFLVFREIMPNEDDIDSVMAKDINISACGIDVENGEAYFCDQKSYLTLQGIAAEETPEETPEEEKKV